MIPTRLELHNFLAYRAPAPIVFEGIELACLTGQNGAGKSSILDAMTWALWGKARAKRDNELIHLGQTDMRVQIDFEQEGARYRVLRRRTRSGRSGRGALDLMVWGDNDRPRVINEVSMRGTQDKINRILRLDYETFVHSAFLQQGRADAFTVKTPAERKGILSDILGLDQWSVYEERVKTILNDIARQIDIIRHDIGKIDAEIAREPQLQLELADVQQAYDAAQVKLKRADEQLSQVANSDAALRREQESLLQQEGLIRGRRDDMKAAQAEIARQDDRMAGFQAIIDQGERIEAGYQQLLAARENQSAIAEQLAQIKELDGQHSRLERQLAQQQAALAAERGVTLERIAGLEKLMAAAADADLEAVQADAAALKAIDEERETATQSIQKMKERRSGLRTRLETLTSEGLALNERLARLRAADGADCPLCGQALTGLHRNEIVAQLKDERDAKREQYRHCSAQIDEINTLSKAQQQEVDGWGLKLKNLPALQQRLGALEEQAAQAREAESALHIAQSHRRQLETRLNNKSYGEELRRQLGQIEAQRSQIGYDPGSHQDVKAQLETYREFDRQHTQLEFAQMNLPEAQKIRAGAQTRLDMLTAALEGDEIKREGIKDAIAVLEVKVEQERELRQEVERFRTEAQNLYERKTIRQQELNAIAAGRESKKRLEKRLDETLHEQGLYRQLRVALGKNGVPAMIIETAIPELEAEANELLARMTDGRMALRLTTQREKVSGGVTETLDIEIADELGTRGYEMYSGGEAFRINFAIRIALSKMLARRAGAHLRTLFIDEGFGSQDDDGRGKLVEAINKIQADFDMVLVITHIEELRDSFPVHVVVEKTANGSRVSVR